MLVDSGVISLIMLNVVVNFFFVVYGLCLCGMYVYI